MFRLPRDAQTITGTDVKVMLKTIRTMIQETAMIQDLPNRELSDV